MGASLPKGGPAGLFLGFIAYGTIILAVNQCFGVFPSSIQMSCKCMYIGRSAYLPVKLYSRDGYLSPYRLALRSAGWILGRRRLEFRNGMELLLSYG